MIVPYVIKCKGLFVFHLYETGATDVNIHTAQTVAWAWTLVKQCL